MDGLTVALYSCFVSFFMSGASAMSRRSCLCGRACAGVVIWNTNVRFAGVSSADIVISTDMFTDTGNGGFAVSGVCMSMTKKH